MEWLARFVSEHALFFYEKGTWVLALVFVASFGVDTYIGRRKYPNSMGLTTLRVLLTLVVVASGALIYMTNFPLKPMVRSLATVEKNIDREVANFEFQNIRTASLHHMSEFRGKVVLLNFWGTYCPPCIEEFPTLVRLEQQYDNDLQVIAVSDEDNERIRRFVRKVESPSFIGRFNKEKWIEPETFRPLTVLIDRQGVVREVIFGKRTLPEFESLVVPILN